MSPGWQPRALQMASRVEKRIAFALLFFKMDRFAMVMSTSLESSVSPIFLCAITTSRLMIIPIDSSFGTGAGVRNCCKPVLNGQVILLFVLDCFFKYLAEYNAEQSCNGKYNDDHCRGRGGSIKNPHQGQQGNKKRAFAHTF